MAEMCPKIEMCGTHIYLASFLTLKSSKSIRRRSDQSRNQSINNFHLIFDFAMFHFKTEIVQDTRVIARRAEAMARLLMVENEERKKENAELRQELEQEKEERKKENEERKKETAELRQKFAELKLYVHQSKLIFFSFKTFKKFK